MVMTLPARPLPSDMSEPTKVLEVARSILDEVNHIAKTSRAIRTDTQLRESSRSVPSNIRESLGRRKGPERNQFLRFSRGSAEETDEHLRDHFTQGQLDPAAYWRLHSRLVLCIKMLNAWMDSDGGGSPT